jgi:hypothetical protein
METLAAGRCVTLFGDYGVSLVPVSETDGLNCELLYCGVMGYSGRGISGSLAIAGCQQLLTASNPARRGSPREWAGELANQLTGHLKSGLLSHGVEVYLSLPTVLRGEHLSLKTRGVVRPLLFSDVARTGLIGIWMDVETSANFQFSEERNADLAGLTAGELLEL